MVENIIIQKIDLAIKINSEFINEQLPSDRLAFLHGRIEAYEHSKEMIEEFKEKDIFNYIHPEGEECNLCKEIK